MTLADRLWGYYSQRKNLCDVKEEIQIVIEDIKDICPRARILLFGSFAEGTATSGSDLDLAVILPDYQDKKLFKSIFFKQRTRLGIPIDFIFRNELELSEKGDSGAINSEILTKGIEIYPEWNCSDKI
ncbi:MAG: nucleotidyltransferase domain-containing protein [Bdellovibrionaceae bacterium]|nr:nucleotidyltransferase domain-containing protein [Pseudobdellovibrionaceae bacterium]